MPDNLAPGLFVEEIDSGAKPIEGAGTNTAAFIGYAKSGDFNRPNFITNWSQFCQLYGEEENAITRALCQEFSLSVEEVRKRKAASRKGWTEYAAGELQKAIDARTATVPNWKAFCERYQIPMGSLPYIEGTYLAHAVRGFYDNGGGRCYIIRTPSPDDVAALRFTPTTPSTLELGNINVKALPTAAGDGDISITVEHVDGEDETFRLKIKRGDIEEAFGYDANPKDAPLTVDTLWGRVNGASRLITVGVGTATATRPDAGTFKLKVAASAPLPAPTNGTATLPALPAGLEGLVPGDFVGDEAQRSGLGGLISIDDANFICVPDLMAGLFQREEVPGGGDDTLGPEVLALDDKRKQAILDAQCALVGHCERLGKRMAILDPLPGLKPAEMREVTRGTNWACERGQAAIYYPWIAVADPLHKGHQVWCPPCGHMAGVWARVAGQRGVHKAPANEAVVGAVNLEYRLTHGEQEILNPYGVNCFRTFPGLGIRAWGACTLATESNPSWKYINIRRHFNYVEASLENGLRWTVFEPNDPRLWGRVIRDVSAFLTVEWREGRLFGGSPAQAYYVKCDSEINTQETIDLGRLYVEIGINPVKPAEFVIIRIGQWTGGASISE